MLRRGDVLKQAAEWYASGARDAVDGKCPSPGVVSDANDPRWESIHQMTYDAGFRRGQAQASSWSAGVTGAHPVTQLPAVVAAEVLLILDGQNGDAVKVARSLLAQLGDPAYRPSNDWKVGRPLQRTLSIAATQRIGAYQAELLRGTALREANLRFELIVTATANNVEPISVRTRGSDSLLGLLWQGVEAQIRTNTRQLVDGITGS